MLLSARANAHMNYAFVVRICKKKVFIIDTLPFWNLFSRSALEFLQSTLVCTIRSLLRPTWQNKNNKLTGISHFTLKLLLQVDWH